MVGAPRAARTGDLRDLTALTGTPGTGKSAAARALRTRWPSVEVGAWAGSIGLARKIPGGFEVDLPRLRRAMLRGTAVPPAPLLVGHLSHLLPVSRVLVLRCHPDELRRRLARSHHGTGAERAENCVAEAIDLVLLEALRPGRRVYEIDTSGRSVRDVAREVARRLRRGGPSEYGRVDWLADAAVTEHILARSR